MQIEVGQVLELKGQQQVETRYSLVYGVSQATCTNVVNYFLHRKLFTLIGADYAACAKVQHPSSSKFCKALNISTGGKCV